MNCPRCGFGDSEDRTDCARCGVVFAKIAAASGTGPRRGPAPANNDGTSSEDEGPALAAGLLPLLLHVEAPVNGIALGARAGLLLLLSLMSIGFLRHGVDPAYLMDSFLHLVNLPFHEAGHVFLMPFGRFVMTLGGSLFQVLIPAVCAAVFLVKNREPFSAAAALWWLGESLMDLAPYIADARALRLPLLGGRTGAEVEGHDWEYLLATLGLLPYDVTLGKLAFAAGALIMVASLVWGALVLARQYRLLHQRAEA